MQIVNGEDFYCTLIKSNGGDPKPCFVCGKRHRGTRKSNTKHNNKQVEAELEALREEAKHEDLRTISQVITARIDKLKEVK